MGAASTRWALLYEPMTKEPARSTRPSFGRVFNPGSNSLKSFNFFVDGSNARSQDSKPRSKVPLDRSATQPSVSPKLFRVGADFKSHENNVPLGASTQ